MNENIKTFSLVVITICVFIMTIIDVLNLIEEKKGRVSEQSSSIATAPQAAVPSSSAQESVDVENQPKTTIQFDQKVYDFGDMTDGDVVKHNFTFTNSGSNPLIIAGAHGSCGCTIPSYPKEPIMPGKTSAIEVQFNSAGKQGMVNKSVTVTANTDPAQTIINFTANVKPKQ